MQTPLNTTEINQAEPALTPKLVYRFVDSSVPPQYHRSYTITVRQESIELTVDSYGEILAAYTLPLAEKGFQKFIAKLRRIEIFTVEPGEDERCSGGITDKFDIILNDMIVNGYVYHCARQRYGNLKGNTDAAARLFRALVPGFAGKIKV